jgi:signal transduction histidine kinase
MNALVVLVKVRDNGIGIAAEPFPAYSTHHAGRSFHRSRPGSARAWCSN